MKLTRRNTLVLGTAAVAAASLGAFPAMASLAEDAIAELTGGADAGAGDLTLTAPEIAENGNTVPIEVSAPGAVMVTLYADGNPTPGVATFKMSRLSPTKTAATRIRLAKTQNVIAIAQMEDGTFQRAQAEVKVTIGGCGG